MTNSKKSIQWSSQFCYALILLATVAHGAANSDNRHPFAVVHPVEDHTKLTLDDKGLNLLKEIKGPVAPVVIIGPYRSGKSFTLNQLLGVACDEGFGVGHERVTQTKGVWMWGEPVPVKMDDGTEVNLLFFDTEGFESTGKADVYDDRIFALSTLISSVLVYNLPESIREGDLEKLSFAVELAKAFYSPDAQQIEQGDGGKIAGEQTTSHPPVEPGMMVWLIQRDFLQGDTLQKTLQTALQPVPNPHDDPGITQLNRIRTSLQYIAGNARAAGLPQPHLNRTHLCELGDDAFDPAYLERREELKTLIKTAAKAKVVGGSALNGPGLADLITRVVTALNEREIPTAGSLVEYFNKDLVTACRDLYTRILEQQALPVQEKALTTKAQEALKAAKQKFDKERFGQSTPELLESLKSAVAKELEARKKANSYESTRVCTAAEETCETVLEREAAQRLPSTGRFSAKFEECQANFAAVCVGPALVHSEERLMKAWEREHTRFVKEYNERLLNGLVIISIAAILFFRFVIRINLGESLAWAAFVFLQVYPKTFVGETSMYDASWWQLLVQGWEALVWNPVIDIEKWGWPLGIGLVLVILLRRRLCASPCCRGGPRRRRRKSVENKDLDV